MAAGNYAGRPQHPPQWGTTRGLGAVAAGSRTQGGEAVLRRAGLLVGFTVTAVGLALGITGHVRAGGLALAPAIARDPLHLMAQVQVFAGCPALMVTLLWAALANGSPSIQRIRAYLSSAIVLCALSPPVRIAVNWAIVTGRIPDHFALLPALADCAIAVLFVLVVFPLSGKTAVGLSGRLMLRSSCWWLIGAAGAQLVCAGARVFLDHPAMLWFLERPYIEAALLGFVLLSGLGLMLATLPMVALNRNLIQSLLRSHQTLNALVFGWAVLQAWSLRYPGSYQSLALALIGFGIIACVAVIAANSGLVARWQSLPTDYGDQAGRRTEVALISTAIGFMLLAGALFAITAFVSAATRTAPAGALAAVVLSLAVGMVSVVTVAVARGVCDWSARLAMAGVFAVVFGVATASLLWMLSIVVERPLDPMIGAAEALAGLGLLVLGVTSAVGCGTEVAGGGEA